MFLPRPYLISPLQDDSFNSAEQFLHPASSFAAKTLNSTIRRPPRTSSSSISSSSSSSSFELKISQSESEQWTVMKKKMIEKVCS